MSEEDMALDSLAAGLMKFHCINFFIFLHAVHIHIQVYTQMLNTTLQSLSLKIISYYFIVLRSFTQVKVWLTVEQQDFIFFI